MGDSRISISWWAGMLITAVVLFAINVIVTAVAIQYTVS